MKCSLNEGNANDDCRMNVTTDTSPEESTKCLSVIEHGNCTKVCKGFTVMRGLYNYNGAGDGSTRTKKGKHKESKE